MIEPAITFRSHRAIGTGEREGLPTWAKTIVANIAREHRVATRSIMGPERTAVVALARDQVVHALKTAKPELAWSRIGRWLGRDHSTVLVAYRRHAKRSGEGA